MSIDQVFSHIKWVQWIKAELDVEIKFPIVAANDSVVLKLGMLHPGKGTNTAIPLEIPLAVCSHCMKKIPREKVSEWVRHKL